MKVVHVYKAYSPVLGGIEGHVQLLAREQARRGHDVTVVTCARGRERTSMEDGVRVVRTRQWASLRSMPLGVGIWRALRRLEADVVHLQEPFPLGLLSFALAGPRDAAAVVTYQSDIVRQRLLGALYRPLQLRLLRGADRVLVTSPRYLETSRVLRRLEASRIEVVPLGVSAERVVAPTAEEVARARSVAGERAVLFVGRLRSYKGLDVLLRAFTQVPSGRLVIVGTGDRQVEVERQIERLGLTSRVALLGDVSDARLAALYAVARVLVLPSTQRSEAFGLVLAEAMMAGLPVISTEVGSGTSWVNRHGRTGLVVPPGDDRELADAISSMLEDEDARRTLGERARRRARRRFDGDVMVERVIDIYRQVLVEREPSSRGR